MTLRWRLTLFYTGLLAVLLTAVSVAVLAQMQNKLMASVDGGLVTTYTQFTNLFPLLNLPMVGEQPARGLEVQLSPARYSFPDEIIQFDGLPFYTAESLAEDLDAARTPQQRHALLEQVRAQGQAWRRRPIGLDPARSIQLTDDELAALIGAPAQRLTITRQIEQAYKTGSETHPTRFLVALGTVKTEDQLQTFALIYVGRDLAPLNDTLTQLRNIILILFLVGLPAAGVGSYLLAGQALRPLRQVRKAAEGIGSQNLGERVPEPATGDEVQALAQALNAMLGRLEASFEAQRRFTSDASHELRTPVTAISGHAGYLLRRTSPSEGQRESLNIIRKESERLTNLIASLLELARSDSGALTLTRQPILSGLFLGEVARELAPLAQAQGTELRVAGEEVTFEGDPDRLKQVVINLVSNALKAGAAHITLQSRAEVGGQEVRLSVADDGPGIPPEHLSRLFDRFYRVEDSRSRDAGGAGLGLSIVKGIVDAHGGRIWLESEVGRGTTVHVQLPVGNVPELDEDVP
ncbi:sensor histidine kinase [Deinococcus hopiensis]|uniref:histidine kinase n=1 Tax=Deinococcus hopiensis KR-140 TaxID=695939 RepID=A0A1W1V5L1_9DEIO|nr:ATP-binding protein [Deinococcus hopiensis]SMB88575.1 heavy metal sensor kinase [Deinococcus hopiensis KR-140]